MRSRYVPPTNRALLSFLSLPCGIRERASPSLVFPSVIESFENRLENNRDRFPFERSFWFLSLERSTIDMFD